MAKFCFGWYKVLGNVRPVRWDADLPEPLNLIKGTRVELSHMESLQSIELLATLYPYKEGV